MRAAAESGDREAQFSLGLRCCVQEGEGRDLEQGLRWYQKAAEQDHLLAQLNLGKMLAAGEGGPQDVAASERWLRRSAEGGDAGAQFALGFKRRMESLDLDCKTRGESRVEAYKWLTLSAEQGYHKAASSCEQVNLGMSQIEVDDGNRRVAAFVIRATAGATSSAAGEE
jgi:TPR repeat protein